MDEKIEPISPDKANKQQKEEAVDPEKFRKCMRVSETELEKKRKRKWQSLLDDEDIENVDKTKGKKANFRSVLDTSFSLDEEIKPTSKDGAFKIIKKDEKIEETTQGLSTDEKILKKDENVSKIDSKKDKKSKFSNKTDTTNIKRELTKDEKKTFEKELSKKTGKKKNIQGTKIDKKEITKKEDRTKIKTQFGKQENVSQSPSYEKQEKLEPVEEQLSIVSDILQQFPYEVAIDAAKATQEVNPAKTDIINFVHQMVGTIVQIQQKGITHTEVVLTSKSFSKTFQGATITFTKYATAPDSYNIRLTGSNEAVSLFVTYLPELEKIFNNNKFDFRVGRIYAEYSDEDQLFKRKKEISEEDSTM